MSPYLNPVTPIKDVHPYFHKTESGSVVLAAKTLEFRIPKRFGTHGMIIFGDGSVTCPGIGDMIFDDQFQAGLNLLLSVTMHPHDITQMTYAGAEYYVLHFVEGNVVFDTLRLLQDDSIVYVLWTEWVSHGRPGYWLNYQHLLNVFEHAKELIGSGIGVTQSVFQGIIAHLSRDPHDIAKLYRLTDMEEPFQFVALTSISNATSSTLARLNGSYFRDDGQTSALRREVDQVQPFEQLLRGIKMLPDQDTKSPVDM